jgi:predicted RecA/RadA family phage recombinase
MADWRTFKFTSSGDKDGIRDANAAGTSYLYLIEDTVGALLETTLDGEEGVLCYHAEKILVPMIVGQHFHVGERVYWDQTTRRVKPGYDSADFWIGICTEAAGTTDEFVEIDLCGNKAEVETAI